MYSGMINNDFFTVIFPDETNKLFEENEEVRTAFERSMNCKEVSDAIAIMYNGSKSKGVSLEKVKSDVHGMCRSVLIRKVVTDLGYDLNLSVKDMIMKHISDDEIMDILLDKGSYETVQAEPINEEMVKNIFKNTWECKAAFEKIIQSSVVKLHMRELLILFGCRDMVGRERCASLIYDKLKVQFVRGALLSCVEDATLSLKSALLSDLSVENGDKYLQEFKIMTLKITPKY